MNEVTFPTQSTATIIKATIAALIMAVVVSLTVILPAEYNIDPTGIGAKLGLTQLSQTPEPVAPTSVSTPESSLTFKENVTDVVVPENEGVEYKFYLEQHGNMTYEWRTTDGTPLYFDFHGEPEGDTTGYFESYTIATTNEMTGSMTAPFAGSHGWYWKNETGKPVTVELKTSGNYRVTGLKN